MILSWSIAESGYIIFLVDILYVVITISVSIPPDLFGLLPEGTQLQLYSHTDLAISH